MPELQIRKAQEVDFDFISDLMESALAPYYDGDHRAHATRIFQTHIGGGKDNVGHFSTEQLMFIIEEDGNPLGMINIVGKRQGTWKISPLIVATEYQYKTGCGSKLLAYAENYARERGARQMYCTVAKQNRSALSFFSGKGYVIAGHSESHYKPDVTEVMLYKLFYTEDQLGQFDQINISVIPFDESHRNDVAKLILESNLPYHFNGVDEQWVEALFSGYQRRHSSEINLKYKLLFVAVDRCGTILGIAGVTPKKGAPIKIMPCVAKTPLAFAALLTDLPQHLHSYGRKLYVHIVPSVEETIVLQRLGWTLDAMMPMAYNKNHCTQQWGNLLKEDSVRAMRVKGRFFKEIMNRRKSLEVRVGYSNIKTIKTGERIQLFSGVDSGIIRVRAVRNYPDFISMLQTEHADRIVPGMEANTVLSLLHNIYPSEKEALGVVVLDIEPTK